MYYGKNLLLFLHCMQVSTGLIPMEAALWMLSRSSVTLRMAAVPPASTQRTGYVLYCAQVTQKCHISLSLSLSLSLFLSHSLHPTHELAVMYWRFQHSSLLMQNAGPVDVSKESYWSLSNLFGKVCMHEKNLCIIYCMNFDFFPVFFISFCSTFVTCSWGMPSTRCNWRCCRSPATQLSRQSLSSARTFSWATTNRNSLEASRKLA